MRVRSLAWLGVIALSVVLLSFDHSERSEAAGPSLTVPAPGRITATVSADQDLDSFVASLPFVARSVSLFDIETQRFLVFIPGAPEAVNLASREAYEAGSIVWVLRSATDLTFDAESASIAGALAQASPGSDQPSAFPVPRAGGLTYGLAGTSDIEALAAAQPFEVESILVLDVVTQRYFTHIPGAPMLVNTLDDRLTPDSVAWIRRAAPSAAPAIVAAPAPAAAPAVVAAPAPPAAPAPAPPASPPGAPAPTASPSSTPAPSPTATPSSTSTPSPTSTVTSTPNPTATPSPTPTAAPSPTATAETHGGCEPIPSSRLAILGERVGYAASATGAASGCLYHVTHDGDDGPGSLREAASAGTNWVVFDDDFEITLDSGLIVGPNTTIDGRGRRITIHGGIHIPNRNVIVTNLTINNYRGDQYLDAISIQGRDATNIWLDHIAFDVTPDELLVLWAWPTPDHAPGRVSVTWSRFGAGGLSPDSTASNTHGILVGAQGGDGVGSSRTRLTLAYNLFETATRSPLIGDSAQAHIFNNYYPDWGSYGIMARRNGQVRSEHNIFAEAQGARVNAFVLDDNQLFGDEVLFDQGSWFPNDASGTTHRPEAVFTPDYGYSLQPADATLQQRIQATAGPTIR